MKTNLKKIICSLLAGVTTLSIASVVPVSAQESIGNGLILSTDSIIITEGDATTFTAVLAEGFDASRLAFVVENPDVVDITPVAYDANAAAYQATYKNSGSTVAAVYHIDNPDVVAYVTIEASPLLMEVPANLGTNHDNYCTLVSYEFVPYDFTYADFQDYKYTLNLKYKCTSYKDDGYNRWGCYGYFYDADDTILSKVHLYCSSLAEGKLFHSEFNVPKDAVRFTIEGF